MHKVIIIDSNAICHRAKHSMKGSGLSFNDLRTDIIYSFLGQILTISEELDTPRVIFVWDSKRNFRKEKYDWYKDRQPIDDPEMEEINKAVFPQFSRIRTSIVPELGFKNNYIKTGLEADDLIASIVMNNKGYHFIVASRDHDLFQLLDYCDMYDFQTKKYRTKDTFTKKWGITPAQWGEVKAIAGCNSDTVPGVFRVGDKTAASYLAGTLKKTNKTYQSIISNKPLIERNRGVVKLPYENTPVIKVKNKWKLEISNFYNVFEKYGMQSFLMSDSIYRWQKAFNLLG